MVALILLFTSRLFERNSAREAVRLLNGSGPVSGGTMRGGSSVSGDLSARSWLPLEAISWPGVDFLAAIKQLQVSLTKRDLL